MENNAAIKRKSLLKNKDFVLTALGGLVSNIGAVFYNFIVSFYILILTNNNSIIQGLYLGVTGLFFVLASPLGGVIVDRFNKAKILWICDYARAFTILATILSIMFLNVNNDNNLTVAILFIGGSIGNIIGAIFAPAGGALVPEVVEVEDLQKANSITSITTAIQSIIGTTLVGVLYSVMEPQTIFFMVAGFYALSGFTEMFIRYNYVKREDSLTLKAALSDLKSTGKYIKNERLVFVLLMLIVLVNFFFNPLQSNFFSYFCVTDVANEPNFLLHEIFSKEIWQSIFSVAISFASIITALILSVKQIKKSGSFIKASFIVIALSFLSIAISYYFLIRLNGMVNAFLITTTIFCFIIGGFVICVNVPIASTLQRRVDIKMYGKVMAFLQMGAQGLSPLAVFLSGIILDIGSEYLLFSLAGGLIITSIISLFAKSIKDM